MASVIVIMGNMANAALANDMISNAAGEPPVDITRWIVAWSAIAILVILAIGVGVLANLSNRFREPALRHEKFVDTLVKGVRKQTERLQREFVELLRVPPAGATNAQAYVRDLRRLLREPASFVRHVRSYPIGEWPSFELSSAFGDWAAIVDSMDSLLADMFEELNAAVVRDRLGDLYEQYLREEWYIRRDLGRLDDLTKAIEKAAKPFKKKKGSHGDGNGDSEHHDDDHH